MRGIKSRYEEYHRVKITDEALIACVEQGKKILQDRSFPDKAIDLMDESASEVKIESARKNKNNSSGWPLVDPKAILRVVETYCRR